MTDDVIKCDRFFKIPYMIWIIGISTMLVNLSSIMVFSLTPIYLTQVFGMTTFHLGILEGIVEFIHGEFVSLLDLLVIISKSENPF